MNATSKLHTVGWFVTAGLRTTFHAGYFRYVCGQPARVALMVFFLISGSNRNNNTFRAAPFFLFHFLSCARNIFNRSYTFLHILLPSTTSRPNNRRFVTRTSPVRAPFFIVIKGYSIFTVARLGWPTVP